MEEELDTEYILVSKPRKSNGSYVCTISYKSKGDKLTLSLPNAFIIKTKPLQQRDEILLYFKSKNSINFICDLNAFIIETVKDNSRTWFNNEMNIELIDDYFTNTLFYDKKYGDIIRLKCIGDETKIEDYVGKRVNILIAFNQLRFYKQKFSIECTVESISDSCIFDDESDKEDDIPYPTGEDLDEIVGKSLELAEKYINLLHEEKQEMEDKISMIDEKKRALNSTFDVNEILRLCHDLESLCE